MNSPIPVSQGCWCLVDQGQTETWRGHWTGHSVTQCDTVSSNLTQCETMWNYHGKGPEHSSDLVFLVTDIYVKSQGPILNDGDWRPFIDGIDGQWPVQALQNTKIKEFMTWDRRIKLSFNPIVPSNTIT